MRGTLTSGRKIEVRGEIGGSELIGGVTAVDEISRPDRGGGSGGGGLVGPPWRRGHRTEPPRSNPQHIVFLFIFLLFVIILLSFEVYDCCAAKWSFGIRRDMLPVEKDGGTERE